MLKGFWSCFKKKAIRSFSAGPEDGEEVLFHSTLVAGSQEAWVLLALAA